MLLNYNNPKVKEKLEEFVSKRKGRIMWGFWSSAIEDGDTELTTLWWVSKEGIIATPLKYITFKKPRI